MNILTVLRLGGELIRHTKEVIFEDEHEASLMGPFVNMHKWTVFVITLLLSTYSIIATNKIMHLGKHIHEDNLKIKELERSNTRLTKVISELGVKYKKCIRRNNQLTDTLSRCIDSKKGR